MSFIWAAECHTLQLGFNWIQTGTGVLVGLIVGILLGILIRRRHTMRPIERRIKKFIEVLESGEVQKCLLEMQPTDREKELVARLWNEQKVIA